MCASTKVKTLDNGDNEGRTLEYAPNDRGRTWPNAERPDSLLTLVLAFECVMCVECWMESPERGGAACGGPRPSHFYRYARRESWQH